MVFQCPVIYPDTYDIGSVISCRHLYFSTSCVPRLLFGPVYKEALERRVQALESYSQQNKEDQPHNNIIFTKGKKKKKSSDSL